MVFPNDSGLFLITCCLWMNCDHLHNEESWMHTCSILVCGMQCCSAGWKPVGPPLPKGYPPFAVYHPTMQLSMYPFTTLISALLGPFSLFFLWMCFARMTKSKGPFLLKNMTVAESQLLKNRQPYSKPNHYLEYKSTHTFSPNLPFESFFATGQIL